MKGSPEMDTSSYAVFCCDQNVDTMTTMTNILQAQASPIPGAAWRSVPRYFCFSSGHLESIVHTKTFVNVSCQQSPGPRISMSRRIRNSQLCLKRALETEWRCFNIVCCGCLKCVIDRNESVRSRQRQLLQYAAVVLLSRRLERSVIYPWPVESERPERWMCGVVS